MKYSILLLGTVLMASAALCLGILWFTHNANGSFGFPLDDPWIHLQFAKNLHEYGSFSYYKNEMVTSGSTSPLYTMLLGAGFFVIRDEMLLSYTLGVLCLLAAGFLAYRYAHREYGMTVAILAAAIIVSEPRLVWAALSGMETTLFIALLLATYYFYRERNPILLGFSAGLLLWTRPEAVLFLAIIGIDVIYHARIVRQRPVRKQGVKTSSPAVDSSLRWIQLPMMIVGALVVCYLGFNLWLSGSILPNTYAAKLSYYRNGNPSFPLQAWHFFTDGHAVTIAILAAIGMLGTLYRLFRREFTQGLVLFLWVVTLFLAYWRNLPFLFQEGRYLMPALPFVALLALTGFQVSIEGIRRAMPTLRKRTIVPTALMVVLGIATVQSGMAAWAKRVDYAEMCRYISDRQVHAAHWMHEHLPEGAVIATHDIGAIAYYSGRRIVDMVGLVSPDMIERIGSLDRLREFLVRNRVTHVAVLRNWFEIVNQNPIYTSDERTPEILEVFEFDAARTHFTPQNVSAMTETARYYLSVGQLQQASSILEQAVRIDPLSSKVHYFLGVAYGMRGNTDGAIRHLEVAIQSNPDYADAYRVLAGVYQSTDPTRAAVYADHYRQLAAGVTP
jgi:tetratricopeptide (TPR) repeat protein